MGVERISSTLRYQTLHPVQALTIQIPGRLRTTQVFGPNRKRIMSDDKNTIQWIFDFNNLHDRNRSLQTLFDLLKKIIFDQSQRKSTQTTIGWSINDYGDKKVLVLKLTTSGEEAKRIKEKFPR